MSATTTRQREFIEMQGFTGLDDATVAEIGPWLRLSPAICMTWAAVGTIMASAAVLFALVPFAVAGALLRGHPFDALYNHGLRHWLKSRRFPVYGVPRRFACAVASVWLITAAIAFAVGWTIAGTVLGCGMVLAAAVPVFTGFCIPSFLYGRLFGGRSARRPVTA